MEYQIKKHYFFLIVEHKEDNKKFKIKFSIRDLPLINNQYWYLDINGKTAGESITAYKNRKNTYISEILFPNKQSKQNVNHRNRDTNDFTRENIFLANSVIYINAHTYKESNKAIPGVCLTINKGVKYWKANYWKEGKQKSFSVKKYGFKEAKKLAEETRIKWEKEYK